jgi:hypothetical protein
MFFTLARECPLERRAGGCGVRAEIGECHGVLRASRHVFQRPIAGAADPERWSKNFTYSGHPSRGSQSASRQVVREAAGHCEAAVQCWLIRAT